MKILVDIGHPAHVHYFRNAIRILKSNGHEILITARKKLIIKQLLNAYNLEFIDRGEGSDTMIGKLAYIFKADFQLWKISRKFKPDLFLSFTTPYPAHVSFLNRKPHIAFNDTEHVDKINAILTHPYCSVIFTPKSYLHSLGEKQIRFNNVMEGFYLHKNYFVPNRDNIKELNLKENEEYVIFRFVSFNSHHDISYSGTGIDDETKRKLIALFTEKKIKVFISSEGDLPDEFKPYGIKITPIYMHDVLAFAKLFIGESATMATESALLGTKAVYTNSQPLLCNIKLGQDANITRHFQSNEGVIEYVTELIESKDLKETSIQQSKTFQSDFIDGTKLLVWVVENYPKSIKILKEDKNYQNIFK